MSGELVQALLDPLALAIAPASSNSVRREPDPGCSQEWVGKCSLMTGHNILSATVAWSTEEPFALCQQDPPAPPTALGHQSCSLAWGSLQLLAQIPCGCWCLVLGDWDVGTALGSPPGHPAVVNPGAGNFSLLPAEMD